MAKVEFKRLEKVVGKLKSLPDDLVRASTMALKDEVALTERTVKPRVPFDTGFLMNSWYDRMKKKGKNGVEWRAGFTARYAWIQHEGDFYHPKRGERYYLRNVLRELDPGRADRIARSTRKYSKVLK